MGGVLTRYSGLKAMIQVHSQSTAVCDCYKAGSETPMSKNGSNCLGKYYSCYNEDCDCYEAVQEGPGPCCKCRQELLEEVA